MWDAIHHFAFCLSLLTIVLNCLLLICWFLFVNGKKKTSLYEPVISVLVAARNEEDNLPACLEALLQTDYPKEKLEIWVGNDDSSDKTLKIAREFAQQFDCIQVADIPQNLSETKGKARVLACLARQAKGEILMITDADVEVPRSWIKGMLAAWSPEVGIVTGMTSVKTANRWGRFQQMDWLLSLGMVKVVTDTFRPVTAMGNNMLVSREAYDATGGYEKIPFSVTEDFALFKAVYEKGYQVRQLINSDVNAKTHALGSFQELLHQRKRWMSGALRLPFVITGLLAAQALFFPAILVLFFSQPALAAIFLGVKVMLQSLFIALVSRRLKEKIQLLTLIAYESYSIVLSLTLMCFYFLPRPIQWKGREYRGV